MNSEAPEKVVRWIGVDHSVNYTPTDGKPLMEYGRGVPVVYVREDLTLDAKLKEPAMKIQELAKQPEYKKIREQYAKIEINKEAKLASDWYNRGLNHALEINIKVAEQKERAELFKQVAVACIRYCTEYVEPEFGCDLGTANKITEQILKASKQFAQKAAGEND